MSAQSCGCDVQERWVCQRHREDAAVLMRTPEPFQAPTPEPPAITPGVSPLTVVERGIHVTPEEMAQRVLKTREEHGELLQAYHKVWYEAPHTWHYLHFLGVGVMKCPNDLWMYQELIAMHRPRTIIETGTYQGGSALWFAHLQDMCGIDGGRVITVDFEDHRHADCHHPRITYLGGDSTDPALVAAIKDELPLHRGGEPYPVLVVLDADHSAEHVRKELELYAPFCGVRDWLVVEDTNVAWADQDAPAWKGRIVTADKEVILSDPFPTRELAFWWERTMGLHNHTFEIIETTHRIPGDRGARGGIEDYMHGHPGEWRQDVLAERWLLTMHPGGWLQRIAECAHA